MSSPTHLWKRKSLQILAAGALIILLLPVAAYAYLFFQSGPAIAYPTIEHYHFRVQMIIDGEKVNFAEDKYQTHVGTDICSGGLTKEPIHFHDQTDQIVHIHWQKITGGQFLKNYGLNLIGGPDNLLGYRLDKLPDLVPVPIFGNVLPKPQKDDQYWVYTGDETKFDRKNSQEFISQDLSLFFGKKSAIREASEKSASLFTVTTYAHSDTVSQARPASSMSVNSSNQHAQSSHSTVTDGELEAINELAGNVVIFAQPTEPTTEQIQERFNHLQPLPLSACAG